MSTRLFAAVIQSKLDAAADVLTKAAESGQMRAASLYVRRGGHEFARSFGAVKSPDDIFLLASISKAISAAAVMTLYDQEKFGLDDKARKHLPEFTGDGREKITMRQLPTHDSGLTNKHFVRFRLGTSGGRPVVTRSSCCSASTIEMCHGIEFQGSTCGG